MKNHAHGQRLSASPFMDEITPPVGLNLYVISAIAPEIPLGTVLRGAVPYVLCLLLAIVILCFVPGIATWLPDALMGPAR